MNDENKEIILNSAIETQIKIRGIKDKMGEFFINHWREIAIIILFIIMLCFLIYTYQNIEYMKIAPMAYCREIYKEQNCQSFCDINWSEMVGHYEENKMH